MIVMPFFFVRLGVKWMLAIGMLAWVARYALFAIGAPDEIRWMIITGIVLAMSYSAHVDYAFEAVERAANALRGAGRQDQLSR
jgi:Na+/melibiose symporter-like transporter